MFSNQNQGPLLDLTNTKLAEKKSFSLIPDGEYDAYVASCEVKTTKAGDGSYFALKMTISSGDQKGQSVFHNLNIKNKNKTAEEIGHQQILSLLTCAGKAEKKKVNSAVDLIGLKSGIVVGHREHDGKTYNTVKYFTEPKQASAPGFNADEKIPF